MWRWILAALLAVSPIAAQTSAGRVTGVVVDSSGAVIPNARVTAQNTETGVDTPSRSNAEGAYVLYPLPAGTYAITAEAAGFRGERIENLQVDVAAVLSRDIRLEVAATKQEPVVVSAATAPLVTESPAWRAPLTGRGRRAWTA